MFLLPPLLNEEGGGWAKLKCAVFKGKHTVYDNDCINSLFNSLFIGEELLTPG